MSSYVTVGTPGVPWGEAERSKWLSMQKVQRAYKDEVLVRLDAIQARNCFDVVRYAALSVDENRYPLYYVKTRLWSGDKKTVLVTGGVHGYETSGVQGALRFIDTQMEKYSQHFNIIVFPCVSPWGYETINRWNTQALDPNRGFTGTDTVTEECHHVIHAISTMSPGPIYVHFDLHETTDTDNSTFRPALAERDGKIDSEFDDIPDGFYLVSDCTRNVPAFNTAMLEAVRSVTHIAPDLASGALINGLVVHDGIEGIPARKYGVCMGYFVEGSNNADNDDCNNKGGNGFATTTEVYPDSSKANPEMCTQAQVACVVAGLDYVLESLAVVQK